MTDRGFVVVVVVSNELRAEANLGHWLFALTHKITCTWSVLQNWKNSEILWTEVGIEKLNCLVIIQHTHKNICSIKIFIVFQYKLEQAGSLYSTTSILTLDWDSPVSAYEDIGLTRKVELLKNLFQLKLGELPSMQLTAYLMLAGWKIKNQTGFWFCE